VTGPQHGLVCRPAEALSLVAGELSFDDDSEHGLAVDEEHDGIGAKLGRNDLGQVGRSESSLGVRGQLDVQGLAQQLGRELRLVAKQQDERLVIERRHRRARWRFARTLRESA